MFFFTFFLHMYIMYNIVYTNIDMSCVCVRVSLTEYCEQRRQLMHHCRNIAEAAPLRRWASDQPVVHGEITSAKSSRSTTIL